MMVLLGVFAGLGAGAIDAGLNTYVAANFSEGIMQWLHAFWGIGITIGPIIMTVGLTSLNTWRFGYRAVGVFQIVLAACFILTLAMWKQSQAPSQGQTGKKLTDYKTPMGETLRQPQVWLSMLLFFLYVGAEAGLEMIEAFPGAEGALIDEEGAIHATSGMDRVSDLPGSLYAAYRAI
jgi:fucose permease